MKVRKRSEKVKCVLFRINDFDFFKLYQRKSFLFVEAIPCAYLIKTLSAFNKEFKLLRISISLNSLDD